MGTRNGTVCILQEADLCGKLRVVSWENRCTHDDVRMAIDVFGKAVNDNVRTEEQGGLVKWRKECVVHDN